MATRYGFEAQLRNFDQEATVVAQYVYGEMAVQYAASRSKALLQQLNEAPEFWLACAAAFQTAEFVALARIFDRKSKFNLGALVDSMERDLQLFQRDELAARKRGDQNADPEWLDDYLNEAHYPTPTDVARIRTMVARRRSAYERAIGPARNKYFAHRERHGHANVQALFANARVKDLWLLSRFLVNLHQALWDQLHNGRRVELPRTRFSVRSLYQSKELGSAPHERIVSDVKKLMAKLESRK